MSTLQDPQNTSAPLSHITSPRRNSELFDERKENSTTHNFKNKRRKHRGKDHFSDLSPRYEFVRYLGHGSYGHVCQAKRVSDGLRVAVKKVSKMFSNVTDAKRLLRELVILRCLGEHESIVRLVEILPPEDLSNFNVLYLVFEYVDTDLAQLLNSPQFFTEQHVQFIMYQILLGLKYIHSANIVHRDMKPANILVNEDVSCKVCDFGLARGFEENVSEPTPYSHNRLKITNPNLKDTKPDSTKKLARQLTTHVVTRWYRPPEVILMTQQREYITAIDMWSVGCIQSELMMMLRGNAQDPADRQCKALFPGRSCYPLSADDPHAFNDKFDQLSLILDVIGTPTSKEINKIQNDEARDYLLKLKKKKGIDFRKRFPSSSAQSLDLLRRLLQFDVEKRFTVDQALAHPWVEMYRDLEAEKRHKPEIFKFEDVDLTMETIIELIVDEILVYHPHLETQLKLRPSIDSKHDEEPEEPHK